MFFEAQLRRGLRMNLGPAIPDDLISGLGNFLQPRFVRAAPVIQKRMRESGKPEAIRISRRESLSRLFHHSSAKRDRLPFRFLKHSAVPTCLIPELGRV